MGAKLRCLKTNRTEYLILCDEGQNFEHLYREWCQLDDQVCNDELPISSWMSIYDFLVSKAVTVYRPEEVDVLSEFYPA